MNLINLLRNLFRKQNKKNRLLIFIGDYACSFLNLHHYDLIRNSYILAISTDYEHLKTCSNINQFDKLFIGKEQKYHCGKRDFESGIIYAKHSEKQFIKSVKSRPAKEIFIVGALRYCSASGVITELSEICKKHKISIKHIVSTPLKSEGILAIRNSKQALENIKVCTAHLKIINWDDIRQNDENKYLIKSINQSFLRILTE